MEGNPNSPNQASATPETPTIPSGPSADDFYGSGNYEPIPPVQRGNQADGMRTQPTTQTPAPAAPTTGQTPPAPAAAPADAVTSDDLFAQPDPATPPTTSAPVTAAGTTPPPATAPATAPATQTPATTGGLSPEVLQRLGVDSVDKLTPEAVDAIVEQRAAAYARQQADPLTAQLREIDKMLAVTDDRALAEAQLRWKHEKEYGFVREEKLAAELDEMEADGNLGKYSAKIRTDLGTAKTTITTAQTDQAAEVTRNQAAVAVERNRVQGEVRGLIGEIKNDAGLALTPDTQRQLTDEYIFNGTFKKDFEEKMYSDPKFMVDIAKRIHPTLGPKFIEMEEARLRKEGASGVWKNLEGGTVAVATGHETPEQNLRPTAEDFYSNR